MKNILYIVILSLLIVLLVAGGCQNKNPIQPITNTEPVVENTSPPTETSVPPIPTVTPQPLAAIVNGDGILLSDFDDEVQRYMDAAEITGALKEEVVVRATVLESMIDNVLLAQAARKDGFQLDENLVNDRYNKMIEGIGGIDNFSKWLQTNHYSEDSFMRLFKLDLGAAWMRDLILEDVPKRTEQIRARQIMVQNKSLADEIYQKLEAGSDFATIAWLYDPITGGELSWFPKNYLVLKDIEDAVFNLQPEQYTPVIKTEYGYQIVQIMERDLDRLLTQDALLAHQRIALSNWVQENKTLSDIIIEIQ